MKKILFLISISICLQSIVKAGYFNERFGLIHIAILEKNVPEFKNFRQKLRELFIAKDDNKKEILVREIIDFGKKVIYEIEQRLAKEKLTDSQKQSLNIVKQIIQKKLEQIKN